MSRVCLRKARNRLISRVFQSAIRIPKSEIPPSAFRNPKSEILLHSQIGFTNLIIGQQVFGGV